MKNVKQDFKEMLKAITMNSFTSDLKSSFIRAELVESTTKPMMKYISSMLKLRSKIDREDVEAVELFDSAHQGAVDAYGMLLALISVYDEHYVNALISAENRKVLMLAGGIVTKEELEDLREDYLKLDKLHKKYVRKANIRINELECELQ